MPAKRRTITKAGSKHITSEETLRSEATVNDHQRQQALKDAFNRICIWFLYAVSLLILGFVVVYAGYLMATGQWEKIEQYGINFVSAAVGYALAYLQRNNVLPPKQG